MKTHNPQNERIKRAYFTYLAEAKGFSEATLDGVAKALNRFETYTRFRDFKAFHIEQAKGFKASLAEQTSARTKDPLSKATLYSTLNALKRFFIWLAGQPGYKSKISYSDAEYFNLSAKETRIAKAHRDARVPTLEQIRHVIRTMPATTEIERRDRALVAFTILTGARDGAIASLKLKHIDIDQGRVDQDAREVKTKFSKSFPTWFFPIGDDISQIVADWVNYLRKEKLWGLDDPLFPASVRSIPVQIQILSEYPCPMPPWPAHRGRERLFQPRQVCPSGDCTSPSASAAACRGTRHRPGRRQASGAACDRAGGLCQT
jgi:site-specific recombinase XerD